MSRPGPELGTHRHPGIATATTILGLAGLMLAGQGCAGGSSAPEGPDSGSAAAEPPFVERAAEMGIDFVHFNGMTGECYFVENVGSGAAVLDYDNDGDLDAYLIQSTYLDDKPATDLIYPPPDGPLGDRLYRNELIETGELRFVDVTEASGIDSTGYGMGIAVGDYDNDGFVDLYVSNYGPNLMLRNRGDGTFEDVTDFAGTDDPRWSASCAFVDYDMDGFLDLIVTNYVDFKVATARPCFSETSAKDYCGPLSYRPQPDRLFRNRGDGTFEDVTAPSQVASAYGAGLGVVCSDFNGDDRVDIYVANDAYPNSLWINQGDGTFRDRGLISGCALNAEGGTEASMGVDAADFDGDGDEDLFMTHLIDETNTLYLNDGTGVFEDYTLETGLANPSRSYTGFGTAWIDYDNDGWLDLIIVNGAVKTIEALARVGDPYPLHEPNMLFRNLGNGGFEEITDQAGTAFEPSEVSRGAAIGDVDNDGDTDVLISNNSGPARWLINEVGNRNHWIGLRMMDPSGKLDMLGTRIEIVRSDGSSVWRSVRVGASYCSSADPRVLVGLGQRTSIAAVRARWPGGEVEEWTTIPVDRYTVLRRGTGAEVTQ